MRLAMFLYGWVCNTCMTVCMFEPFTLSCGQLALGGFSWPDASQSQSLPACAMIGTEAATAAGALHHGEVCGEALPAAVARAAGQAAAGRALGRGHRRGRQARAGNTGQETLVTPMIFKSGCLLMRQCTWACHSHFPRFKATGPSSYEYLGACSSAYIISDHAACATCGRA